MPLRIACGIICKTLFSLGYVVCQACECFGSAHMVGTSSVSQICLHFMSTTNMQESNSGKQHYLRARFTRAGSYRLAVAVVDPVSSETVQIPPHSTLDRLIILPGAAVAERTLISDLPERLTAGKLPCSIHAACTSVVCLFAVSRSGAFLPSARAASRRWA